jgi:hypothetical protein
VVTQYFSLFSVIGGYPIVIACFGKVSAVFLLSVRSDDGHKVLMMLMLGAN